jgi:hypothetical protein
MATSYNFKNHITIDNGKYIQWLDNSSNRHEILSLKTNTVYLNSLNNSELSIASGGNSKTIINSNNSGNVYIGSKLAIGIGSNVSIDADLTLKNNAVIGISNTTGSLTLTGSTTFNTLGSTIKLYGDGFPENNKSNIEFYTPDNLIPRKRMTIYKNGTLEYTPDGIYPKLIVNDTTTDIANQLKVVSKIESTNSSTGSIISYGGIAIMETTDATSASSGSALTVAGGVGIGKSIFIGGTDNPTSLTVGGALIVNGGGTIAKDLYVGGLLSTHSDTRLKTDITEFKLDNDKQFLDIIDNIHSIKFKYKNDLKTQHIGFIAQEFVSAFPEITSKVDGFYALDYSKTTVILLECIKELKNELNTLKKQIA